MAITVLEQSMSEMHFFWIMIEVPFVSLLVTYQGRNSPQ